MVNRAETRAACTCRSALRALALRPDGLVSFREFHREGCAKASQARLIRPWPCECGGLEPIQHVTTCRFSPESQRALAALWAQAQRDQARRYRAA